jgi:type IV pilus assembly protein PilX
VGDNELKTYINNPRGISASQRGVVLLLALIMLIAMTLAGIALYRQIGSGLIVARNLSFKRTAAVASDRGIETARTWLTAQTSGSLEQGSAANGYFPGWCNTSLNGLGVPDANTDGTPDDCGTIPAPSEFDPLTFNWANAVVASANDGGGNEIRYVIHRLCETPGGINAANQQCVTIGSAAAGASRSAVSYGTQPLSNTSQPYFRVTSRVLGPTNTVVYTQVVLY